MGGACNGSGARGLALGSCLLALALALVGCGEAEQGQAGQAAAGEPRFVPVEPLRIEETASDAAEASANRPAFRLPTEDDGQKPVATPAMARFYVNAPDDPGPANQAYAENAAPARSLAHRLARNEGDGLRWRPRWLYQGTGGVALTAAALSVDGSVLALVETASMPGQADDSLVVLIDTYRWRILGLHALAGRRLVQVDLVPGRLRAVAVADRQPEFETMQEILAVGLRQGQILSQTRQVRAKVVDLVAAEGNAVFVLGQETAGHPGGVWRLDALDLEAAPRATQGNVVGTALAASLAANRVAVAGPQGIVLLGFGDLHRRETQPTPGIAAATALSFLGAREDFAVLGPGQPVLVLSGGVSRQLAERAGAVLAWNHDGQLLLAALEKGNALATYRLPDGDQLGECTPAQTKPRTQGTPWATFWLPHLGKHAVVDTHGNLCLYHQPGRKWRKELILDAKR
jgi:hypothetical protein